MCDAHVCMCVQVQALMPLCVYMMYAHMCISIHPYVCVRAYPYIHMCVCVFVCALFISDLSNLLEEAHPILEGNVLLKIHQF